MGKRIIVALGGNAILSADASAQAQEKALADTAKKLAVLVEQGNELIISHGNGPQVGNLLLQQAATDSNKNPAMPLDTCVAMTQGSIGYWMQKALRHALKERGIMKEVATILTEVVVDENDPAFKNPTKPICPFLTEDEAKKLAELIDADLFIILTGVDNVYINFNKPDQKMLEKVTTSKLKQYIEEGQFAPGSMLPKVEAAIMFAEQSKKHGETVITSLENLTNVIEHNGGTRVVKG